VHQQIEDDEMAARHGQMLRPPADGVNGADMLAVEQFRRGDPHHPAIQALRPGQPDHQPGQGLQPAVEALDGDDNDIGDVGKRALGGGHAISRSRR
jgi:hypothetical protein